MLSIHVLKQFSSAERYNETNRSHRQEAESGVAGVELVDLLRDEHDVVDDVLICAITSYLVVSHFPIISVKREELTEANNPETGEIANLP